MVATDAAAKAWLCIVVYSMFRGQVDRLLREWKREAQSWWHQPVSVKYMPGKLWRDVRDAISDTPRVSK